MNFFLFDLKMIFEADSNQFQAAGYTKVQDNQFKTKKNQKDSVDS